MLLLLIRKNAPFKNGKKKNSDVVGLTLTKRYHTSWNTAIGNRLNTNQACNN